MITLPFFKAEEKDPDHKCTEVPKFFISCEEWRFFCGFYETVNRYNGEPVNPGEAEALRDFVINACNNYTELQRKLDLQIERSETLNLCLINKEVVIREYIAEIERLKREIDCARFSQDMGH
jgi:hypothetical protein